MNAFTATFTIVAAVLLLTISRRFAAVPLLLGALYVGRMAEIEIGPAHFTVLRILVAVGFLRVIVRGEHIVGGMNAIDRAVLLWGVLLVGMTAFHTADQWVFRAGLIWTELGSYFLLRVFIRDVDDLRRVVKALCVLLVPIALGMLLEKALGQNLFAVLGGEEGVAIRDGHIRARGPFTHAILAGTVGAACLPLALWLWKGDRKYAVAGLFGAGGMVFAATSSGPIMMVLFIGWALALWKLRRYLSVIRWGALGAIIALDMVMKDPFYFLMARIDIGGGSKGWHRAKLIQSSIEHIDEWWLVGTDYTRHWMPTGIHANTTHTDITNHILGMGVMGGLPLMLAFVWILVAAFVAVGRSLRKRSSGPLDERLMVWALGSILFGHVMNFSSISLFDQSVVFFYLILAAIGAVQVRARPFSRAIPTPAKEATEFRGQAA